MVHPRSAYSGSESRLVIAIDVGTTFSGASYTLLIPDEIPEIYNVGGYKGQEDRRGDSKVPSVLFYSPEGDLLACGAEVRTVEAQEGIRTEWFKLELRPPSMKVDTPSVNIPSGFSIIDVFGDFLKYMYDCVRRHIIDSQLDGKSLWYSFNETAHFVLSHPNGWGHHQQHDMREAAIRGGLIPDTPEGHERVEFVSEGEASFHWCIDRGTAGQALKEGTNIVVADLGGGTIDVSSFIVQAPKPLRLSELKAPECALAGSITVTDRFMRATTARLQETPYSDDDYLGMLRDGFDQKTKCIFGDETPSEVYIPFAGRRDHFVAENGEIIVAQGRLVVRRQDLVDAFEPSVTATIDAIRAHLTGSPDVYVFLVGGLSASPWMFSEIKRRFNSAGIQCHVKRPDNDMAKAAAYGGVAFYLDRHVSERIMRHTYGVILDVPYHPEDPEHQERSQDLKIDPISGKRFVRNGFFALVTRGQLVKVDRVYRERARSDARSKAEPVRWSQTIQRYSGVAGNVTFMDMDPNGFEQIGSFFCQIPPSAMTERTGPGGVFWAVDFDIVITLGTVEMKVYVEWVEKGVRKKTQAKSIWEDYY